MADFEKFAGRLLHLEGGYVPPPLDKGGPIRYEVILAAWEEYGQGKDRDIDAGKVSRLTGDKARKVAKQLFWDYFNADAILNQSVADFIVDWGYHSGRKLVTGKVQQLLDVAQDGRIGPLTLDAIHHKDQEQLFAELKMARFVFIDELVARNPEQGVLRKGWHRRINSFQFSED